jgi:hypothetical protein
MLMRRQHPSGNMQRHRVSAARAVKCDHGGVGVVWAWAGGIAFGDDLEWDPDECDLVWADVAPSLFTFSNMSRWIARHFPRTANATGQWLTSSTYVLPDSASNPSRDVALRPVVVQRLSRVVWCTNSGALCSGHKLRRSAHPYLCGAADLF